MAEEKERSAMKVDNCVVKKLEEPLTHLFEGLVSEQVLPRQSESAERQKNE